MLLKTVTPPGPKGHVRILLRPANADDDPRGVQPGQEQHDDEVPRVRREGSEKVACSGTHNPEVNRAI